MDDNTSETESGGELAPPPRHQITAIAASARQPQRAASRVPLRESLRGLVEAVLDRLDVAADRIADAAGLR